MITAHVFDTYATTAKGKIMHFDVVLKENDAERALHFAKQWLQSIGESDTNLSQKNCVYCHSAEPPLEIETELNQKGYAILKLEGCPA